MFEAIILSLASFILGGVVGALCAYKNTSSNKIKTPSGTTIQMWKSYFNPEETYVACNMDKDGEWIDGDTVVFDRNGRINYIKTSWSKKEG